MDCVSVEICSWPDSISRVERAGAVLQVKHTIWPNNPPEAKHDGGTNRQTDQDQE